MRVWRSRRLALVGLLVSMFLVAAVGGETRADAQAPEAFVGGEPGPGVTLALFSGGSVDDLRFAATRASSFWTSVDGGLTGYLVDAPDFVNQTFLDHFVDGVPASTPLIVLVPEEGAIEPRPPVELSSECVHGISVGVMQYHIPCELSVVGSGPLRVTWTVIYIAQSYADDYEDETVVFEGQLSREFTFDQHYQSLVTITAEVCNPWSCAAVVAFFDG